MMTATFDTLLDSSPTLDLSILSLWATGGDITLPLPFDDPLPNPIPQRDPELQNATSSDPAHLVIHSHAMDINDPSSIIDLSASETDQEFPPYFRTLYLYGRNKHCEPVIAQEDSGASRSCVSLALAKRKHWTIQPSPKRIRLGNGSIIP